MTKNLNELSKKQLQDLEKQLSEEIKQLNNVIEASNTPVFDLLIREVKKEMHDNIAEEEWKKLKENQKKIDSYRSIEKTLQNQEDLLERKEEELEDVQNAIKCYQKSLFEQPIEETDGEVIDTGFKNKSSLTINTGDVYKSNQPNVTNGFWYYLIKKSSEKEGSFAIISNFFEGERLLQYSEDLELLNFTHYVGNIYMDDESKEGAVEGLKIITDSREQTEGNNQSTSDEPESEPETDS